MIVTARPLSADDRPRPEKVYFARREDVRKVKSLQVRRGIYRISI